MENLEKEVKKIMKIKFFGEGLFPVVGAINYDNRTKKELDSFIKFSNFCCFIVQNLSIYL